MEIVALDGAKLLALMAAGAVFALAGLWLIFKPKSDGHDAKIELFGLKFQSSSAGLLVFLIGAAFLAVPIFVPEMASAPGSSAEAQDGVDGQNGGQGGDAAIVGAAPPAGVQAIPVTSGRLVVAEGEEVEKNDTLASSNEIPVGASIKGETTKTDTDYYSFTFPKNYKGVVAVTADGNVGLKVWDDLGARIQAGSGPKSYRAKVALTRYYVSVETWQAHSTPYTLNVAAREE